MAHAASRSATCKTDYGTGTSTHAFRGETRTTQMTIKARWLGADCGDLKPLDPKR